ncbi:MAG: citrate synthase, partial [Clostridia bacterium]
MDINSYCQEIKEDIENYAKLSTSNSYKDNFLYTKYDVKRGLRDANGKGVVTGLTNISDVIAFKNNEETGEKEP